MPVKIFICYAHEDEPLLNTLKTHLRPLQREGLIDIWHDQDIGAGAEWEQEIKEQLNTAQIILLLVSPDFMNSDYCYGIEMTQAIERHDRGEARVIPVILRPVDWRKAPFSKLYALPKQAKPVTTWQNRDVVFLNITKGIRKAIDELTAQAHINPSTLGTRQVDFDMISTLPQLWNVPYRRNPFFTDRDEILQSLYNNFKADRFLRGFRPQALCGLGGVGKTQIAIEYAYRYHSNYRAVLWVKAESRELLTSDLGSSPK